jgi:hypothetical protein
MFHILFIPVHRLLWCTVCCADDVASVQGGTGSQMCNA